MDWFREKQTLQKEVLTLKENLEDSEQKHKQDQVKVSELEDIIKEREVEVSLNYRKIFMSQFGTISDRNEKT